MEKSRFDPKLSDRIKIIWDLLFTFLKTNETLLFNVSFSILSAICALIIFMAAVFFVPEEISRGRDAAIYLSVAEAWLNGRRYLDINYDFGISLFEILAIIFGTIFSLDPLQSLILSFSIVSCLIMSLLAVLSRVLTGNKWSYHLTLILLILDFRLLYLSVRPLTDTFHAMLILLIVLIQLKLLNQFNIEQSVQNSIGKTPLLAIILGVCLGILTTIRHAALVFLPFVFLFWIGFIYFSGISKKRKIMLLVLIIVPAITIVTSYLFSRAIFLGNIEYIFYFGATSNIWIDSGDEQ